VSRIEFHIQGVCQGKKWRPISHADRSIRLEAAREYDRSAAAAIESDSDQ